jgi:hypothetical protein
LVAASPVTIAPDNGNFARALALAFPLKARGCGEKRMVPTERL